MLSILYLCILMSLYRHLHLLCYLQMTNVDLQANTFELLILCTSALELCMESSLQPLKYQIDRIVDALRSTLFNSHDSIWDSHRSIPKHSHYYYSFWKNSLLFLSLFWPILRALIKYDIICNLVGNHLLKLTKQGPYQIVMKTYESCCPKSQIL